MKINAMYVYEIKVVDIVLFLQTVKANNIKIYKLSKIDKFTYRFVSSFIYKKIILQSFKDIKVVNKTGLLHILFSFIKYKTTLIALVISVCFYISLSNKIWKVEIIGDTLSLNNFINQQLIDNNIYIGAKKLNVDDVSKIQNKILYSNYDVIEYLSIKIDGCKINVSFKKKREESEVNKYKKSLYAKKDGVIKSFDLLSGVKVVEINQYVRKDDLLVKDVVTTDYNQDVYVGTFGSVYAYTWYYVTINEKVNNITNETIFANTMMNIKNEICKNFSDNEYIYEENVLKFKIENNILNMKVHFTCVEDIAKE